jgi:P27 family predicted phage terminase small subunit
MAYPRKPAALKRLQGNPGKRAIAPEPEPGRLAKLPRCPSWVTGEGRRAWVVLGKELLGAGLLTSADVAAFGALCQQWGIYTAAAERIAHDGVVVKLANGAPVRSPWVGIANGALDRVVVLLREFGGSPAARSRVALAADASPAADDLAKILFGEVRARADAGGETSEDLR